MAGVYAITNLVTGRIYIGSSVNVPRRWREHLSNLTRRSHPNVALQSDWSRYGSSSFTWSLLAECVSRADAIAAEQRHIDQSTDLYNAATRAGSGPRDGFRQSEAARLKMSEAQRGRPKSDEHKAKLADAKRGKPCPAQALALRGRTHSPEHCEKIRLAHLGSHHTPETKAKMSAAQRGRIVTWGDKVSAAKRGKPWSAARRATFIASQAIVLVESEV